MEIKNLIFIITKSLTPVICLSFILGVIFKIAGFSVFSLPENSKLTFTLLIYFINTTGLFLHIYKNNIYRKCLNINRLFFFFISLMYLSLNDINFNIFYPVYIIVFTVAVIIVFFVQYLISMKVLNTKPKLFFNLSSEITDYTFILFILLFGINSQFVLIPLFISFFDFIYVLAITSVWLHLNKRFNMKQNDKI